jgi:hypothetical protein
VRLALQEQRPVGYLQHVDIKASAECKTVTNAFGKCVRLWLQQALDGTVSATHRSHTALTVSHGQCAQIRMSLSLVEILEFFS